MIRQILILRFFKRRAAEMKDILRFSKRRAENIIRFPERSVAEAKDKNPSTAWLCHFAQGNVFDKGAL